jgi:hypothetical protein
VTVKRRVRILILNPQNDIIRESSSSPEPDVRPRLPRCPPRRWSWRFRMPSQHPMTLRSHTRRVAAAAAAPLGSLLADVQPLSRGTTVQTPRGKFMNLNIIVFLPVTWRRENPVITILPTPHRVPVKRTTMHDGYI